MNWVLGPIKATWQCACGDDRAEDTFIQWYTTTPLVSQYTSVVQAAEGDTEAALETQKEFGKSMAEIGKATPGVGHLMGVGNYIRGEDDEGNDCMTKASRTTSGLAGGALGALAAGPPGAVAGGIAAGQTFDAVQSYVTEKPCGAIAQCKDRMEKGENIAGEVFDVATTIVGDGLTGKAGGKIVENIKASNQAIRDEFRTVDGKKVQMEPGTWKTYRELKRFAKDIRRRAGDTAPKEIVLSLAETEDGTRYFGVNDQVRKLLNTPGFEQVPEAWIEYARSSVDKELVAKYKLRPSCGETQTLSNLGKDERPVEPSGKWNVKMTTVKLERGRATVEVSPMTRCKTCKNIDMNHVSTDLFGRDRPIPSTTTVSKEMPQATANVAAGSVIEAQFAYYSEDSDDSEDSKVENAKDAKDSEPKGEEDSDDERRKQLRNRRRFRSV